MYLSAGIDDGQGLDDDFVSLGRIKGNIGSQNYELPADIDLTRYKTVVLWCRRFSTAFGTADLRAQRVLLRLDRTNACGRWQNLPGDAPHRSRHRHRGRRHHRAHDRLQPARAPTRPPIVIVEKEPGIARHQNGPQLGRDPLRGSTTARVAEGADGPEGDANCSSSATHAIGSTTAARSSSPSPTDELPRLDALEARPRATASPSSASDQPQLLELNHTARASPGSPCRAPGS